MVLSKPETLKMVWNHGGVQYYTYDTNTIHMIPPILYQYYTKTIHMIPPILYQYHMIPPRARIDFHCNAL